ncbi:uncharacterized protein GIQ15_04850 [Arthroderma uncinatum]|uniref:uncharacterized protein n=1 Tax=Arthroderma uncinatum TaxID=74035 RepID=UPI00144A770F|nr:uncharacterized protein GIQ15_04850 [Arthroderma uncinatum]KAF3482091.1 hypothetical protein GIQ15_04850 [Arthroderma uncinatum]
MYPRSPYAPRNPWPPKQPIISTCPDWIIEQVVSSLELADIRNLRLTGKTVSLKSSQGRFRCFLQSKNVDLTSEALQTFVETKGYTSKLKNLNLVGLAVKPNQQKEADKIQERETLLLTEVFNKIAEYNGDGCLESLTLRVILVHKDGTRQLPADASKFPWEYIPKRIWACAVYTWKVALRALAASRLRIKRLNAFNDANMQQCSIPCDRLTTVDLQDIGLAESLASLKSLSLSICDRIFDLDKDIPEYDKNYDYGSISEAKSEELRDFQAEADEENNFDGVANLVNLCGRIEDFELHHYHNRKERLTVKFHAERILQCLVELEQLPRLRKSKLRGISATGTDLLNYIIRTDPSDLTLERIKLQKGEFSPNIDHCTSDQAHLHTLLLDTLYEDKGKYFEMVLFPWYKGCKAIVQGIDSEVGRAESLKREGNDIRQPLLFIVSLAHFQGSPVNQAYSQRNRLEFGAW